VAGISQLEGNNLRAGVYGIYLDPSFKSPSTGQKFDNQEKWHAAPQLFYTYGHSNCPVTVGIGSYSPFGLALQWPSGTGFQTLGTEAKIVTETINPVIAIKLSPTLSIGGGVMINYAHLDLEQQFPPAPGNGSFQFKGDGWSLDDLSAGSVSVRLLESREHQLDVSAQRRVRRFLPAHAEMEF
jgi:long-chain fatty acid transport protein